MTHPDLSDDQYQRVMNAYREADPIEGYDVKAEALRHADQVARGTPPPTWASGLGPGKTALYVVGAIVTGGAAAALLVSGPANPVGQTVTRAPDAASPKRDVSDALAPVPTSVPAELRAATESDRLTSPIEETTDSPAPPRRHRPAAARTRGARAEAPSPEDAGSIVAREIAELQWVRKLLDQGKGADALRVLDSSNLEFQGGYLRQERDGLRVLALNGAGRKREAKKAAEAFLARYPRSTVAAEVQGVLAGG